MSKYLYLSLITTVLLFGSHESFAADDMIVTKSQSNNSYLYFGIKAGNADYDAVDDSDISLDLFLGYQLDELLSVQGGFATLGDPSNAPVLAEVSLLHAEIVVAVALRSDLALFGQVGMFAWDYDETNNAGSDSDSGVDVAFGFGLDYKVSGRYAVRFGVDFYSFDPDVFSVKGSEDIINYAVGVKFNL